MSFFLSPGLKKDNKASLNSDFLNPEFEILNPDT